LLGDYRKPTGYQKVRPIMTCKERLEAYLREQQVPFVMQHHRAAYSAQDVAASEHIPGKQVAKVAMVFADGKLTMLVLPASHRIDLIRAGTAIGAKSVYLAGERELEVAFADCEVGAMPPFGNLYHVPVYVDQMLAEDETIVFQAGTHTDTITMQYADFARLVKPTVVEFAFHPQDITAYAW
jgi:Ala-tRNA(Pro) deacylase